MARTKEKTIDELLRVTEKLLCARPSCVLEGKAKMRGPGHGEASRDVDIDEDCEKCKTPIHHGELGTCSTCERGFHAACLEVLPNASVAGERLCKECHEVSLLKQSEASSKRSVVGSRRKSVSSKADSLAAKEDITSKVSAVSSSQDTSQQGSKSMASESDIAKNSDSVDKGQSNMADGASSFISEDSNRGKDGGGETSEQSPAFDPVRRSKRGRPYKPVRGLHPNKRRSVEHAARHCEKVPRGKSVTHTDEEDELGAKIEKFKGLKDLSSANDEELVLDFGDERKASTSEKTSVMVERPAEMIVKVEDQVTGKCRETPPHKKLVDTKSEGDDSKNCGSEDTAVENCVRRTGKISPVGLSVERCAPDMEKSKLLAKLADVMKSKPGVEHSEFVPATSTIPFKDEKHGTSVAGVVSLDQSQSPGVQRLENGVLREEVPGPMGKQLRGKMFGSSPSDVLEHVGGKGDNVETVKLAVSFNRDKDSMDTHSKHSCGDADSVGVHKVGDDAFRNEIGAGDCDAPAEGKCVAEVPASVRIVGEKTHAIEHVQSNTYNPEAAVSAADGEVSGRDQDSANVNSGLCKQLSKEESEVIKSGVEQFHEGKIVQVAVPLSQPEVKADIGASTVVAAPRNSIVATEGRTSQIRAAANPETPHQSTTPFKSAGGTPTTRKYADSSNVEVESPIGGSVPSSEDKIEDGCGVSAALTGQVPIDAIVAEVPKRVEAFGTTSSSYGIPKTLRLSASKQSVVGVDIVADASLANGLQLGERDTADMTGEKVNTDAVSEKRSSSSGPSILTSHTQVRSDSSAVVRANSAEEEDADIKESENASSLEDIEDIKLCDICGDPGYEECLAVCSACNEGAEHIYCMQVPLVALPDDWWKCEVCKTKESAGDSKQTERQCPAKQPSNLVFPGAAHLNPRKKSPIKGDTRSRLSARLDKRKASPQKKGATKGAYDHEGFYKRPGDEAVNPVPSKKQALDSACTPVSGSGLAGRALSKEGSFKSPDSGKVKFLSPNALASIPVGRNSGKSSGSAGFLSLSRPSTTPTGVQLLSKIRSGGHNDLLAGQSSAGSKHGSPTVIVRSSAFPVMSPSPLSSNRGTGSQRTGESGPSFSRSSSMKYSNTPRPSKESSGEGSGLPPLGRDGTSGGGNIRSTGSASGKLARSSSFIAPDQSKWGDAAKQNMQTPIAGMKSPRLKTDVGSGFQSFDATGISPGVERLSGPVNLPVAKTVISKNVMSSSESDIKSGQGTRSAGKNVGDSSKMELLRPAGIDVGETLRSTATPKSVSKNLDEPERRPPGNFPSKVPLMKGSMLAEDASPKTLLNRVKDVKRKDSSDGCWSSLKNTPSMGITRCYKCKEMGHTAQNCSSRITAYSTHPEIKSAVSPSGFSSVKSPRENVAGASDLSFLKGSRPKPLESHLPGAPSEKSLFSKDCAPAVNKPVSVDTSSTDTSPAELEQTTSKKSSIVTADSTSCLAREELPEEGGTPLSRGHVRIFTGVSSQNSRLALDVSDGKLGTTVPPVEQVRSDSGSSVPKDATRSDDSSASKSLNQVRHPAPVLTHSGISAPGVSTGNLTPALGVVEPAVNDNVARNFSREISQGSHIEVNPLARPQSTPGSSLAGRPLETLFPIMSMVSPIPSLLSATQQQRGPSISNLLPWVQLASPPGTRSTFSAEGIANHDSVAATGGSMTYGPGASLVSPGPPAVPESQFLWSGGFVVVSPAACPAFYDGLEGYSSSFAAPKVRAVTKILPPVLQVEEVRRTLTADAWPKQFQQKPPTDKEIALYFFPKNESFEKVYDSLVEHMVTNDLVLMGEVEGAEILIFPSVLLPAEYHRWKNKLFLWGVYRSRKTVPAPAPPSCLPSMATPSVEVMGQTAGCSVSQLPSGLVSTGQCRKEAEAYGQSPAISLGTGGLPQVQIEKHNKQLPKHGGTDSGEADMEIDMVGNKELGIPEKLARKCSRGQPVSSVSPPLPSGPAPVQPPPPGVGAVCPQDEGTREITNVKDVPAKERRLRDLDIPPGFGPPRKQLSAASVDPQALQKASAAAPPLQIPLVPSGPSGFPSTSNVLSQPLTSASVEPPRTDMKQNGLQQMPLPPPPPPIGPPGFEVLSVSSPLRLSAVSVLPPGFEKPAGESLLPQAPPRFDSSLGASRSNDALPSGPPGFGKIQAPLSQVDTKGVNIGEVENPEKNANQQHDLVKKEKNVSERRDGSVHTLSRSSSRSPTRNRDRTKDLCTERPGYHVRDRGREKDRDREGRREKDRGRDTERDRERERGRDRGRERDRDRERERDWDRERERGKDRVPVRERANSKERRYKERGGRARDNKYRRHARSRSPSRSRSRSASRRKPRSPSVSPKRRLSLSKYRSRHKSGSHSDSPDSYRGRPLPRMTSLDRRADSREQSNEAIAVVRRDRPRVQPRERNGEGKSAEDEVRNKGKGVKPGEGIYAVPREERHKMHVERTVSPIPFWDMEGPVVGMEELVGEKSTVDAVPQYHVFLPAESREHLEGDASEDAPERPFFPVGVPSPGSSSFEARRTETAPEALSESYIGRAWEEDKKIDSSGYQFFPMEAGRVTAVTESSSQPNLDLGLGGKNKKSSPAVVEPLPLFVAQDVADSSPDNTPCRFIEPPGLSSASSVKEESQNPEASSPLNLTLAVPQYRKEGNSWVKVDDTEAALGEEDVDFALTL